MSNEAYIQAAKKHIEKLKKVRDNCDYMIKWTEQYITLAGEPNFDPLKVGMGRRFPQHEMDKSIEALGYYSPSTLKGMGITVPSGEIKPRSGNSN